MASTETLASLRAHNDLDADSRTPRSRWGTAARVALGLAVAASGGGALAVAQGPGQLTTYAGSSDLAAALTFPSGGGLGVAGLLAAFGRLAQDSACSPWSRGSPGSRPSWWAGSKARS